MFFTFVCMASVLIFLNIRQSKNTSSHSLFSLSQRHCLLGAGVLQTHEETVDVSSQKLLDFILGQLEEGSPSAINHPQSS